MGKRFALAGLTLALFVSTFFAAAGAAAAKPTPVTLTVASAEVETGASVTVTARVKRLPHGYRLVIRVTKSDATTSTVASCAAPVCSGQWTESRDGAATFQAFLQTKPRGGRIVGRSRVAQVTWHTTPQAPPPPPPPPPPTALAGHYCGLTNEGKSICFDVTSPQAAVQNLTTEMIANCGDGSSWIWTITFNAPLSIHQSTLTISYPYSGPLPDSSGATNVQISYQVDGTFDSAGNANGTIHLNHVSWDQAGTHYECAGDPRTWTARLGA
ncbi:MAG TPA: hypothetical protein VG073_07240 [Gaiellaceae bacterium]|nr:hypothetical protein [Gaiellaceae bacterium]